MTAPDPTAVKQMLDAQALVHLRDEIIDKFSAMSNWDSKYFVNEFYVHPLSMVNFRKEQPSISYIAEASTKVARNGSVLRNLSYSDLLKLKTTCDELMSVVLKMKKFFDSARPNNTFDEKTAQQEKGLLESVFDENYKNFTKEVSPLLFSIQETNVAKIADTLNKIIDQEAKKGIQPFSENYKGLSCNHASAADFWLGISVALITCTFYFGYCEYDHVKTTTFGEKDYFLFFSLLSVRLFLFALAGSAILWCFKNYRLNKHSQLLNKQKELSILSFTEFSNSTAFDDNVRKIVMDRIARTIFDNNNFGYIEDKDESLDTNSALNLLTHLKFEKAK